MAQDNGTLAVKGQPKKEKGHAAPLLLKDIGLDRDISKRAQKLAAIPEKTIAKYIKHVAAAGSGQMVSRSAARGC